MFEQQVFDISQGQGKPDVEHHHFPDQFGRGAKIPKPEAICSSVPVSSLPGIRHPFDRIVAAAVDANRDLFQRPVHQVPFGLVEIRGDMVEEGAPPVSCFIEDLTALVSWLENQPLAICAVRTPLNEGNSLQPGDRAADFRTINVEGGADIRRA
jgi:hypothetical protein